MADTLDEDLLALKEWLSGAWRRLSDPSLTSFERRELRNYMQPANDALRAGLKRIVDRSRAHRQADKVAPAARRLDFRIIKLEA
jgi:hypothetical protein